MYEQFMGDITYRDSEPRKVQLFLNFVNFRATSLLHLFKFPLTVVLYKTLFPILDICFEQNILV